MKSKSYKYKVHKMFTFVNNLDKIDLEILVDYGMNVIHCYIMASGGPTTRG